MKVFLEENKGNRKSGLRKQEKRKTDMLDALKSEGFQISYSTVSKIVNSIERKSREAYIKQRYNKGDTCEFYWGTVKLDINGVLREYQMAIFTSAYGNYRYARVFPKQNTNCFLEAHALFFEKIGGVYQTLVFDNMKVAVKKFVGYSEKEPTEALAKLSMYYGFKFRFCNIYSGNEKCHVERSVDVIRRKAFSHRYAFADLVDANKYLETVCDSMNSSFNNTKVKKTPNQLLEEEKKFLLPYMPMYETADVRDLRVDKYSTIIVDSCHYSIPDSYVDCLIRTKVYSTKIICFYENKKIAEHIKLHAFNE